MATSLQLTSSNYQFSMMASPGAIFNISKANGFCPQLQIGNCKLVIAARRDA